MPKFDPPKRFLQWVNKIGKPTAFFYQLILDIWKRTPDNLIEGAGDEAIGALAQISELRESISDLQGNEGLVSGLIERISNLEDHHIPSYADLVGRIEELEAREDVTGRLSTLLSKSGGEISGDTWWWDGVFPIIDKASGNGIKVDSVTPTFGFADIIGDQFSKNTGATKPALATYNGVIQAWQFGDGDEAYMSFHIPHDYVASTDIHLHIHWSQTSATDTGGTLDFKYFAIYAKGHNQASGSTFTATPKTATFSSIDINDGASGLNQYQHFLTEVTISAATATAALFDRDDFEPDGVIELTFEMDANNLTGPGVTDPFIHFADIHYQSTGLIGTKSRTPDFYA